MIPEEPAVTKCLLQRTKLNLLGALVLLVDGLLLAGGGSSPHGVEGQEALLQVVHLVPSKADQVAGPHLGGPEGVTGESQRGRGHQAGAELEE